MASDPGRSSWLRPAGRLLACSLMLLVCHAGLPSVRASENNTSDDPMVAQNALRQDLSEKSDVELIDMERELRAKLGLEPANADLYLRLSSIYAVLFDRTRTQKGPQYLEWLTKSRDALDKVLMIRPKDKIAHYNLGVVYKRLGEMERSREELRKAIQLCDPAQDVFLLCSSWMQIGAVYEERGFFDEAKEAYLKAREFDFENPDIRDAIRHVDELRKAPKQDAGSGFSGMPFMGSALYKDPQTAAAMGLDPNAQNQNQMAQVLPALAQGLMQKFGGGGGGDTHDQGR